MPGNQVDWIRQQATDSQIQGILDQRDRLIAENAKLKQKIDSLAAGLESLNDKIAQLDLKK